MDNIWKFSLVFAFTVIFDQMLKGTVQGFLRPGESLFIWGDTIALKAVIGASLSNLYLLILYIFGATSLAFLIRETVIYRNGSFSLGMMRTFSMAGIFTLSLDLLFTGYFVDYILICEQSFSIGKVLLMISVPILVFKKMRSCYEAGPI